MESKSLSLTKSTNQEPEPSENAKDLESPKWQNRFKSLYQYKRQARFAQAENRREMAVDEDFYDKIQMEEEDLAVLAERRQPALVYNITKNTINWILGTEKKARIDYRILPRTKADSANAKAKTKAFKYIEDVNFGPFHQSKAFADCIKAGVGWFDLGVRDNGEEPIFVRSEEWRNIWFDHLGTSLDCSDWRYVFREKWIDLDILTAMWPSKKDQLETTAENVNSLYPFSPDDGSLIDDASEFDTEITMDRSLGVSVDYSRPRIKATEMWYRIPARVPILKARGDDTPYGALEGALYRPKQPDHAYLVKGRYFTTVEAYRMIVRQAIWAGSVYLQDTLSPYNHWRFPLVPMFCYRRKRDNMPYGVIRDIRDPQIDLNQRRRRSLFLLTAHQMMYEKGAIDDPVSTQEEINRPDGSIELNEGALTGGKFKMVDHIQEANAHVSMAQDDERFVQSISGVTDENLGKKTNAISGKAIEARQLQGNTTSGVFFDNYYLAFQLRGEIENSLIEQFMDQEKEILVTGDRVKDEFVTLNQMMDDGTIENCITRSKARFIVGKQDFRETIRQAMFETLSELITNLASTMPDVSLALLDMVVDYMDDLPNKDELVARIRKINGQRSPEEDMTDEEKAQAEQAEQAQAEKQAMLEQLDLAIKQAQVATAQGQALKLNVEAAMKKLEGYIKSLEAAGLVSKYPMLTEAADMIMAEAEGAPDQPQENIQGA